MQNIESPVFDLHCDAVLKLVHKGARFSTRNPVSHVDIPKMKEGGVDGIFYSLWADPIFKGDNAVKRTQFMLDVFMKELETCREELSFCLNKKDLENSRTARKISAFAGIEGGSSINNSLSTLKNFFDQGVRRMTLTHTCSVDWAGSATDGGRDKGLTDFGKDVVRFMNDLGMVVDLAHTSEKTFLDAAKISTKPIFCSHSLARSIFNAERLATDEMISAVGESGGVFGVTFLSTYFPGSDEAISKKWVEGILKLLHEDTDNLSTEEKAKRSAEVFMDSPPPAEVAPIRMILPHMDHVISLIGEDHVGIGSDFDGMPFGPKGLEDCSKYDNLRVEMQRHGYSNERIAKILGQNVRRVLKEILP